MQNKRTVKCNACAPVINNDAYRTAVEFWGNLFENPATPGTGRSRQA